MRAPLARHGFQDAVRRQQAVLHVDARRLRADFHVGVGRQVPDNVVFRENPPQPGAAPHIEFMELQARVRPNPAQPFGLAVAQVVDDGDLLAAGQQGLRQMASDEAGAAGNDVAILAL